MATIASMGSATAVTFAGLPTMESVDANGGRDAVVSDES